VVSDCRNASTWGHLGLPESHSVLVWPLAAGVLLESTDAVNTD